LRSISCRSAALAAAAACALACALHAPTAEAQQPLALRVGYGVTWDDNVFRLPDNAPDPQLSRGISGKSDRFSTAFVGLSLDKPYSLQRILLDVTKTAIRYDKFSSRDQDPLNYRGAWQWQVTPRITGALNASRSETAVNIEDVAGRRSIDQTMTTLAATADATVSGAWHLLGGVSETKTTYSEPFLAQPDTTQTTAEAGLRYAASSTSQVSVTRRQGRGTETFSDPAITGGSDFTVDETEVSATWVASARSTLNARATYIERSHDLLPQRDFSGTNGALSYAWQPTGRLSVNLSAVRTISPFNLSLQSTTRTEETLSLGLAWQLRERIAVQPRVVRRESRFGQVSTSPDPTRRDISTVLDVGATWTPRRYATLTARLMHEQRDSTDATQTFEATTASVNLAFTFQ